MRGKGEERSEWGAWRKGLVDRKGQEDKGARTSTGTLIVKAETGKNVNDFMKKVLRAGDKWVSSSGNWREGGGKSIAE